MSLKYKKIQKVKPLPSSLSRNTVVTTSRGTTVKPKLKPLVRTASASTTKPVKQDIDINKEKASFFNYLVIGFNFLIIASLALFIWRGTANQQSVVGQTNKDDLAYVAPLDGLASTELALNIASVTNLSELESVQYQSDAYKAQLSLMTSDEAVATKPQIISNNVKNSKDITVHTVAAGETVEAIAQKYNVTSDSIKWSNGLTSNSVQAGKALQIPPRNGIVYDVKDGDTVDTIAAKYKANAQQIIAFNDAEVKGLKTGDKIVIPDGLQPEPVRVATPTAGNGSYSNSSIIYNAPVYAGNGYSYGYCTYWAASRRIQEGNPVPSNWGNANMWDDYARGAGYVVDHNPEVGAVFQTDGGWVGGVYTDHYIYHVAYVEQVNDDGSIVISEMNYVGWNVPSRRTIPASKVGIYNYIH